MRPGQGKKIKKDPKQSSQWKRLLVEARLSRQLHYMKLHRQQNGQLDDHIKVLAKSDNNRTDQLTSQSNDRPTDPPINQPTNQIIERPENIQTEEQPTSASAQSAGTLHNPINSRLNNTTIDEMISEIQHQIIAQVNNQPFYVEQELRRRRREQDEIFCRICFLPTSEMYQPCRCDGTMKYIHRRCLSDWIKTNRSRSCNICYARYTGLTIHYHYPSASAWLTSDLFAVKQMICFLILIVISFALYSRRALEFYASKLGAYRRQAILVRMGNYFEKLKTDRPVKNGNQFGEETVESGPETCTVLRQTNSTIMTAVNGLFNFTGEAACRVCHRLCDVVNDTVVDAVSDIGNKLARQVVSNQNDLEDHAASFVGNHTVLSQPASKPFDVYYHHHLAGDQLADQFTYSTNVFFWYLLVYLVNDLIQIVLYAVVCMLFIRYFVRQWLIWRHRNRSAEVVFAEEDDRPNRRC